MDTYVFIFTVLASTESFVAISVALFLGMLYRRRFKSAIVFLCVFVGASLSTIFLKEFFAVPRPEDALVPVSGYAFPSGHAMGAAFLAMMIGFVIHRAPRLQRYGILLAVSVVTVAVMVSRVHLNVHTPLQVYAGASLGVFWALLYGAFMYKRKTNSGVSTVS